MRGAIFCLLLTACGGPLFTSEATALGNVDAGELEREALPKDAGDARALEAAAGDGGAELDALGNADRLVVDEALPNAASDARALEAAAGPVVVGGACDLSPWQANECEAACQRALQGHGSCPEGTCVCR